MSTPEPSTGSHRSLPKPTAGQFGVVLLIWFGINAVVFLGLTFLVFAYLNSIGTGAPGTNLTYAMFCAIPAALVSASSVAGRRLLLLLRGGPHRSP